MDLVLAFPPSVRSVMWLVFCKQNDTWPPRFIVDCVACAVITIWVTVLRGTGAQNSGMDEQMCMSNAVKDDTQLWLMNSFKKSTKPCVKKLFHDFRSFWWTSSHLADWSISYCHRETDITKEKLMDGVNNCLEYPDAAVLWRWYHGTTSALIWVLTIWKSNGITNVSSIYNKCFSLVLTFYTSQSEIWRLILKI